MRRVFSSYRLRIWQALPLLVALAITLLAQTKPDRLVLVESSRFHFFFKQSKPFKPEAVPVRIASAEYSATMVREKILPLIGNSIAVGDYDGDGRNDLLVISPETKSLLRNGGDGSFRDVTAKAKLSVPADSLSGTFCDYDRSGHQSLFIAGASGLVVFHNNGDGTFSDATRKTGIETKTGELCTRAVVFDVDNDGFPDLLVTIYTDLSKPPAKSEFYFPNDFAGAGSRLYRNNGDGTFADITSQAGLTGNSGRARNAVFGDFNGDARQDLLILRDDKPPALYLNKGRARFAEATWEAGDDLTRHAYFEAAVTDFNHDGKADLAVWSTLSFQVLINDGKANFERAESIPILPPSTSPFGFRGMVADLGSNGLDDALMIDKESNWHFFANQAGSFHEIPLSLSLNSSSKSASAGGQPTVVTAISTQLAQRGPRYLLAMLSDGRIVVLNRQALLSK